jgi:hypothetical protein
VVTDEPTPEALDLDALEGIALMADHGGRPWADTTPATGYPQRVQEVGTGALVAQCYEGPETFPPTAAPFIAAFDPPTVPALIALARSATS